MAIKEAIIKNIPLRNLVSYVSRGISPSYVESNGFVVLNQKCIRENRVSFNDSRLTNSTKKVSIDKFVKQFDVLVNSTGVGTLGRLAQFKKLSDNLLVDSHVTIVRPKEKYGEVKINPVYFGYSLIEQESVVESLGRGATGQTELSKDVLLDTVKINLPEYTKQNKIADVLRAYDDLIEVNQKKIKILKDIAQTVYKEWFVKPVKNGLLEEWRETTFSDSGIFKKSALRIKKFEGKKLYFDTSCIDGINISKEPLPVTFKDAPSRAQFIPTYNSVWFARMSNTYKVLVFDKNSIFEVDNYLLSSGMLGVVTEEKYLGFLFILINSEEFHKQKDSRATGATQVSLTDDGFSTIKFTMPPKKLIEKYSNFVNEYIEEILSLQKQNKNLQKTRDLLIPQLVGGKLLIN